MENNEVTKIIISIAILSYTIIWWCSFLFGFIIKLCDNKMYTKGTFRQLVIKNAKSSTIIATLFTIIGVGISYGTIRYQQKRYECDNYQCYIIN